MAKGSAKDQLRAAMERSFPQHDARLAPFYQMMQYHLGWRDEQLQQVEANSGKLIRPRLSLLGCRIAGAAPQRALPLAAAIQLIHDFTLVHDDIQDRSEQRRGRPTVWRLWGEAQGINAGDGLFVISHLALAQLAEAGVPPAQSLEIMQRFDQIILTICEGQYLDLSFEDRLDLNEQDYLGMIERKTAVLIAGSLQLGGLAGNADASLAQTLWNIGIAVGLAFQIEDDLLGIWGDPSLTGKPYAADLYRRKKSLPVVYALAHAGEQQATRLRQLYQQHELSAGEVEEIMRILEQAGARTYAAGEAARHHQQALASLAQLPPSDPAAVEELRALAQSLLGRAK